MMIYRTALLVLLLALFGASCSTESPQQSSGVEVVAKTETSTAEPDGADEGCGASASHNRYSPFTLKVSSGPFEVVSFKDVGLMSHEPVESDPLLETIAESLSHKLTAQGQGSQVNYSAAIMDPTNHCACESSHLYVDLWRTQASGWGYSLWSGCGEEDQFAWREVVGVPARVDLIEQVEPLTQSILDDLSRATRRGCFRRSC
ncbi:MAG: hypothetical protein AAFS10_09110 [Myxococcota bacterium]